MILELLADMVALALERFAEDRLDPKQCGDAVVDLRDQRISRVEIAGVAGAGVGIFVCMQHWRRDGIPLDLLAQLAALVAGEEAAADVKLDRAFGRAGQLPQAAGVVELLADRSPDLTAQFGPLLSKRDRRLVINRPVGVGWHGR